MIDERILIDAFTAGITDPDLDVVKSNVMPRHELVGDFDAVAKCYGDYIKKMQKTRKISEVKNCDNRSDDGHQGDGGGNRRGGCGGGSWTGRGGGGNNRGRNPVVRILMTVPTSRTSTCPRECTRITMRTRKQSFMSCAWLAWIRKELGTTGRSMSVRLSPCSVILMKPEWGMMTHPMMRPTYLIVPTFI